MKAIGYRLWVVGLLALLTLACNPEAPWTTKDVNISIDVTTVSAGFVECSFSTDKSAYYLIGIVPVEEGVDPMAHQKQFMQLALDSANVNYLEWRNWLLKEGEFNIAPFSSHVLQYGATNHFFTGLMIDQPYWIYAFVVDPDKMVPAGKLHLVTIRTKEESIINVHFDYRVKGRWDYIYPLDSLGRIYDHFPYIATTRDSAELAADSIDAVLYFVFWMAERFGEPDLADVYYGVRAVENNAMDSYLEFEEGHTYYTAIGGYDGSFRHTTIYKFKWTGDSCAYYFTDSDSTNVINKYRDDN